MRKLNFEKLTGLIPVIIQEEKSAEVLMLGYTNRQALQLTLKTGYVYFWSRSRRKIWLKGESSGNKLRVKNIFTDCDRDTLLIKADLIGSAACHWGYKSCFREKI